MLLLKSNQIHKLKNQLADLVHSINLYAKEAILEIIIWKYSCYQQQTMTGTETHSKKEQ